MHDCMHDNVARTFGGTKARRSESRQFSNERLSSLVVLVVESRHLLSRLLYGLLLVVMGYLLGVAPRGFKGASERGLCGGFDDILFRLRDGNGVPGDRE